MKNYTFRIDEETLMAIKFLTNKKNKNYFLSKGAVIRYAVKILKSSLEKTWAHTKKK